MRRLVPRMSYFHATRRQRKSVGVWVGGPTVSTDRISLAGAAAVPREALPVAFPFDTGAGLWQGSECDQMLCVEQWVHLPYFLRVRIFPACLRHVQ